MQTFIKEVRSVGLDFMTGRWSGDGLNVYECLWWVWSQDNGATQSGGERDGSSPAGGAAASPSQSGAKCTCMRGGGQGEQSYVCQLS